MSGESGVCYKGAASVQRIKRNDRGDRGGWCTSEQRYKGTNKERGRETLFFQINLNVTSKTYERLRIFPVRSIPAGYTVVLIRLVSVSLLPRIPLCLCLSIYLSSFFPTKRPNERANDGRKRREGNTRACLSILETQRREALWSLDEKRRRNGLEKESLGSVPLVTVNSNKRCLRIASFNRTGRQTFSRAENHRQKPYRNDALRSPRQFPPIRIENFQPVRLCFHLLEQVVRANAKIVRVFVNRAE